MKINRTAMRTIEILDIISKHRKGLTLKEIMRMMDIPQTSAFDILQTLLKMNVIEEKNEEFKRYSIGIKAYEIGMAYSNYTDIIHIAEPYLEELGEKLGKTTFLGILDNSQISYIFKYEPSNTIITTAKIGSRNELYCTSLGKVLLAFSEDEIAKSLMDQMEYVPKTNNTITSKEDLHKEINKIRQNGYAIDDRELEEHIFCIGAPIFDSKNNVIAAISATGLYKKDMNLDYEVRLILHIATLISQRLGNVDVIKDFHVLNNQNLKNVSG